MYSILLVDDETYVTASLERTIPWGQLGIDKVWRAASGAEAILLLQEQQIDVLVTDIRMPVMSGLELMEEAMKLSPGIRCMLLTGYADFAYAQQAVQLQASAYLLKPVVDEEFIASIKTILVELQEEKERDRRYHLLASDRRGDYQVLRTKLLQDLLLGVEVSSKRIAHQLEQYEIGIRPDEEAVLLLIQPDEHFSAMDASSFGLYIYAIGNIAEEVLGQHLHVWQGQASHNQIAVLLSSKHTQETADQSMALCERELTPLLRRITAHVEQFLGGTVSIAGSQVFRFPDDLPAVYRRVLAGYLLAMQQPAEEGAFFVRSEVTPLTTTARPLASLYQPPTLIQLLEADAWDQARQKLEDVFAELREPGRRYAQEHAAEACFAIINAFIYIAHKHGKYITRIDDAFGSIMLNQELLLSLERMREWLLGLLDRLQVELAADVGQSQHHIIKQVQLLLAGDLGEDISVKTLADRLSLHPVYLSKLYKSMTGEALGDTIIRLKMERAYYLLQHTNKRIYEITAELGYQNPQYFSKLFRKFFGMSPNELREGK